MHTIRKEQREEESKEGREISSFFLVPEWQLQVKKTKGAINVRIILTLPTCEMQQTKL